MDDRTDPINLDELALALAPSVARARQLMAEHVHDPVTDRCVACVLPTRPAPIWPCATHQLAERAQQHLLRAAAR